MAMLPQDPKESQNRSTVDMLVRSKIEGDDDEAAIESPGPGNYRNAGKGYRTLDNNNKIRDF
jgi:hypothetical protein